MEYLDSKRPAQDFPRVGCAGGWGGSSSYSVSCVGTSIKPKCVTLDNGVFLVILEFPHCV